MSSHSHVWRPHHHRGFTLVELVVVMVIVGILGAIGAARFLDRGGFDTVAFADQTRAMLRFSQKLAVARNAPVYTQMDGKTIALCLVSTMPCPAASRVPAIGGNGSAAACGAANWYCEAPPGTIAYALDPTSSTTICFTPLGQPGLPSGSTCSSALFAGFTMNLTVDKVTTPVTIAPETGYVF